MNKCINQSKRARIKMWVYSDSLATVLHRLLTEEKWRSFRHVGFSGDLSAPLAACGLQRPTDGQQPTSANSGFWFLSRVSSRYFHLDSLVFCKLWAFYSREMINVASLRNKLVGRVDRRKGKPSLKPRHSTTHQTFDIVWTLAFPLSGITAGGQQALQLAENEN